MEGHLKMIQYHEDKRNELYHLGNDIGEQNDLMAKKRGQQMRKKLDTWLKQTDAKFPKPDPEFDSAKRAARWKNIETSWKRRTRKTTRILSQSHLQAQQGLAGKLRGLIFGLRIV